MLGTLDCVGRIAEINNVYNIWLREKKQLSSGFYTTFQNELFVNV